MLPHRPFDVERRNPLEGTTFTTVSEPRTEAKIESALLSLSVETVGKSNQSPHLPLSPVHRNVEACGTFSLGLKNLEVTGQAIPGQLNASSSALRTQNGNIDSQTNSPALSEKSFATAEGGSSGVHIRLSDPQIAENGEALAPTPETRNVVKTSQIPPASSGSAGGKSSEGKREKGLMRGLKNSLRRSRG
jgi:hypothetical protein